MTIALAAAVAFGWSTALMHHSASGAPRHLGGPVQLLQHLVGQWRWLAGMAASLIGLALHAWALHLGSLALVQPLVVTGLVFSFVFRAALDRQLPSRGMMAWVVVTAVGLALFLVAVSSTRGSTNPDGVRAALLIVVGSVVAVLACAASLRAETRRAGVSLGISGGVVFGLIAGALKATTDAASRGSLFTSWPLYVVLPLGLAGFLLNQRAYHTAPLSSSLPALNLVNPVVAVLFGIAAFHERPSGRPGTILIEAIGLGAVLAGIFFLARTDRFSAGTAETA